MSSRKETSPLHSLTIPDLERQKNLVEVRRKNINAEITILQTKRTGLLARIKDINKRCHDGKIIIPETRHLLDRESEDTKSRILSLQEEMGRLGKVLKKINHQIQCLNLEAIQDDRQSRFDSEILTRLSRVRDHYEAFAADPTRVNSKRLMAAQFAKDLTEIIREVAVNIEL